MVRISVILSLLVFVFAFQSTSLINAPQNIVDGHLDSIRHMMQWRAKEMKKIRQWIINHSDSTLPFTPTLFHFSSGIPSDSDFITPSFFVMDSLFHKEYVELYRNPSITQYNNLISVCESCHNTWCPGPLRLIKKLYITSQPE
ncbi:MAG: hypothetical protein GXO48_04430 [Chlorobi bacterium]|nr:hypothetical protein [Chlorobiota bacterium]